MLSRYKVLPIFSLQINLPDLSELLPTEVEDEAVDAMLKKFCDLGSVTKAIQDELIRLAKAHALFDEVILRFLSSADRLETEAALIEHRAS